MLLFIVNGNNKKVNKLSNLNNILLAKYFFLLQNFHVKNENAINHDFDMKTNN